MPCRRRKISTRMSSKITRPLPTVHRAVGARQRAGPAAATVVAALLSHAFGGPLLAQARTLAIHEIQGFRGAGSSRKDAASSCAGPPARWSCCTSVFHGVAQAVDHMLASPALLPAVT